MAVPIWKDYIVTVASSAPVSFRITADGATIYQGVAYPKPGASGISIRINDICADFLKNVLPDFSQTTPTPILSPVFRVQHSAGGAWVTLQPVQFINDWSYEYDYNPDVMGMSFPIDGRADRRQYVPVSASVTTSINYINEDGRRYYDEDIDPGTTFIDLSSLDPLVFGIDIGNPQTSQYKIIPSCLRYALYYINAFGGWDAFLIQGNERMSDTYSRKTRQEDYDNNDIRNRGAQNYLTEITRAWTLHTGFMNDDQSGRMHHILGSTFVYLHDLDTGEILPVLITNTETEHKTYHNNGNRLNQYTIDVELAQTRMRR